MATKKPSVPLTMDYQGGASVGIELAFCALDDKPKTRAYLLEKLQAQHAKMLAREAATVAS